MADLQTALLALAIQKLIGEDIFHNDDDFLKENYL